jgi:hypothetical protein
MEIEVETLEFHWANFLQAIKEFASNRGDLNFATAKVKPHLDRVKYVLLEEDRQILLEPTETQIGECIEYASRKNFFSELVKIAK